VTLSNRTNKRIPVSWQLHSTGNIKSAVNKVSHSKTFLPHNVILHSRSRRTLKFTFNQTLISRDFSILLRLPELSIPQTKKDSLKRPVRQVLPTDQRPKLRAGCMLLDNYYTTIPEACIPSSDWFEYQQSINLLIISIAVVDVDASLGWFSVLLKMWLELVIEIILVIVIVSFMNHFSYYFVLVI